MFLSKKLKTVVRHRRRRTDISAFARKYALFSVIILLATSVAWSILGASVQRSNADQIVSGHLFDSADTLRNATFPSAHSFLIKWPLFWLISLTGNSGFSLALFTVISSVATITGLAFVISRIEKRPIYFGTICLALASVLLLVPAQPYAGALLPLNMAMLSTRNIEYILFITSLYWLIKAGGFKDRYFWLGVLALSLLAASDRIFIYLSLGGSLALIGLYIFRRSSELLVLSRRWMGAALASATASLLIIWLLAVSHITSFAGSATAGPYSSVKDLHSLVLGMVYAISGLFTNFGANPAFDTSILRDVPSQLYHRIISPVGPAYLINIVIFAIGLLLVILFFFRADNRLKHKPLELDPAERLSLMLLGTSLSALVIFVATKHYWAADGRYLTIVLFSTFIIAATTTRRFKLKPNNVATVGVVFIVSIIFGLVGLHKNYNSEIVAMAKINNRNSLVAQVMASHTGEILLGDYWRVMPIKMASKNQINVDPLESCTSPLGVLSSKTWQPNLNSTPFAYLLTLDHGLTNYGPCSLDQIISAYGRPNNSALIDGSLKDPTELVLFYDRGANKSHPVNNDGSKAPATVKPVPLSSLTHKTCDSRTVMNIVAHEDDDLLFINPATDQSIKDNDCVRTIYITAGDAGHNQFYWLSRESGSEAAYDYMDGPKQDIWIKRIVEISDKQFISVDNPRGNAKLSLIFMHLPDGNVGGQGFKATNNESLAKLEAGQITTVHTVDGQSSYDSKSLVSTLVSLMQLYHPAEVRTQANFISRNFPDHSDHVAVGRLTRQAWQKYNPNLPIKYYIGYPVFGLPANVNGADLIDKQRAFFGYAQFDESVCHSLSQCEISKASYGAYLQRQYTNPE